MNDQPTPEVTSAPPITAGPLQSPAPAHSGLEQYNRVAETVGMMPSFRKFDYIFQGSCVVLGALVGAGIGWFFPDVYGSFFNYTMEPAVAAILGGIGGFVVMGILSGLVLMVLGWVRALKK